MRRGVCLALIGFAAAVPAQVSNSFHVYDGIVEYTSRGNIGSMEGEILIRVPGTHFGCLRTAVGTKFTLQDQNDATRESYYLVVRNSDGQGKPDITPAGLIYQEGPYTVSGSGGGAVAVFYPDHIYKTPVILPDGEFFYGARLGPVGNGMGTWTADGAGIWMSGMYPLQNGAGNPGPCGEHMRVGIKPQIAWDVLYQNGQPASTSEPYGDRTWSYELKCTSPLLQAYAVDPIGGATATPCTTKMNMKDYGFAGLWPDLVDLEQYGYKARFGWRVRDNNTPSGVAVVFVSSTVLPSPLVLPFGKWFLMPGDRYFQIIGGFTTTRVLSGEYETATFNPPDEVRYALLGMYLYTQALVVNPTTMQFNLTNWCGVSY